MFEGIFTIESVLSLLSLTVMEILLGIDNVIFVSIVMSRLNTSDAKKASMIWMVSGIIMRISLLFILVFLIKGESVLFNLFNHPVQLKDLIMLGGGLFLLVNSTLEIHNKVEGANEEGEEAKTNLKKGFKAIIIQILLIDLVFSMDGIITAIGMANKLPIMATAVLISMIVMFYYSPKIASFINKHPTFKILALSFLVLIAVLLVIEGIHVENIHIPKGYIYFAMAFSFIVELLNLRFRKKTNPVQLRSNTLEDINSLKNDING
ncbi:MAG: TerC family protein [Sphingobacteriaceae bacterium]|nr:TerC family protein [Sphingobacteriaceae bacterium]